MKLSPRSLTIAVTWKRYFYWNFNLSTKISFHGNPCSCNPVWQYVICLNCYPVLIRDHMIQSLLMRMPEGSGGLLRGAWTWSPCSMLEHHLTLWMLLNRFVWVEYKFIYGVCAYPVSVACKLNCIVVFPWLRSCKSTDHLIKKHLQWGQSLHVFLCKL